MLEKCSTSQPKKNNQPEELSSISGSASGGESGAHVPLNESLSGGKQLDRPESNDGEADSSEEDVEPEHEDDWVDSGEAKGSEVQSKRERKVWKMDITALLKLLQAWVERTQALDRNEGTEEELTSLVKKELVRQLKSKKVFVSQAEANVSEIIPLVLQLRLVSRVKESVLCYRQWLLQFIYS